MASLVRLLCSISVCVTPPHPPLFRRHTRTGLTDFFSACDKLYGKGGCNISAVAVHDYSCTPSSTMSYLETVHNTFHLPVWLTEFSCGDGADGKPTSDQLAFMRAIFPLLDAAPHVERYAWMSARDGKGLRGLVADGKLTAVGQLFNTV